MRAADANAMQPDDTTSVADALVWHYRTHGLPLDGGAADRWFRIRMGRLTIPLPNPPARRRAVILHDINHLVTGYNTVFSEGEMSIAAFEVGAGCGRFAIAWYLNLSLFAVGLFVRPRRVFAGFVRGRRSASIYHDGRDPSGFRALPLGMVRAMLRVDAAPTHPGVADRVHFALWALVAVIVYLSPMLVGLALWWAIA